MTLTSSPQLTWSESVFNEILGLGFKFWSIRIKFEHFNPILFSPKSLYKLTKLESHLENQIEAGKFGLIIIACDPAHIELTINLN